MSLPSFNFLYITAGEGKTGTSGEQLEVMWTTNFNLIKSLFNSLDADVQKRILSNEIKQIKVDNGIVYYSTDGENWTSLQASFASLVGSPDDNLALTEKFNEYVTVVTFNALDNRLSVAESSIIVMNSDLTLTMQDVTQLKAEVEAANTGLMAKVGILETKIADKISSPTIIKIREHSEGELEYTTDGTNWHGVSESQSVLWGSVLGDIRNQLDLMNLFDAMGDRVSVLEALKPSITNHLNDTNNPHQVTASQLGLGNVDNTSDANKPVSTAQKAYIDGKANVTAMTHTDYENLSTVDANSIYLITDKTQ